MRQAPRDLVPIALDAEDLNQVPSLKMKSVKVLPRPPAKTITDSPGLTRLKSCSECFSFFA